MRIFGKAQLIGVAVVSFDPHEAKRMTARLFTEHGKTLLHWHDDTLSCHEAVFVNESAALSHAERVGATHIIVGLGGTLMDRVSLQEARLMSMVDGAMAFQLPFSANDAKLVH